MGGVQEEDARTTGLGIFGELDGLFYSHLLSHGFLFFRHDTPGKAVGADILSDDRPGLCVLYPITVRMTIGAMMFVITLDMRTGSVTGNFDARTLDSFVFRRLVRSTRNWQRRIAVDNAIIPERGH
jgi:hypothetical protein